MGGSPAFGRCQPISVHGVDITFTRWPGHRLRRLEPRSSLGFMLCICSPPHGHGVPAKELQRQLGVTYKTAWRMGHEIRKYMAKIDGDDGLSGHVEIDESYVGGKRPGKRGRGAAGKTVVLGMVERDGDIMTKVVLDTTRKTIHPLVEMNVQTGAVLSTDEFGAYIGLSKKGYTHNTVNHSEEEWARGDTHVNTVEGFWSHFKNSVRGTHKSISGKHTTKYLGEFEFRFNLRADVTNRMFDQLILAF